MGANNSTKDLDTSTDTDTSQNVVPTSETHLNQTILTLKNKISELDKLLSSSNIKIESLKNLDEPLKNLDKHLKKLKEIIDNIVKQHEPQSNNVSTTHQQTGGKNKEKKTLSKKALSKKSTIKKKQYKKTV